MHVCSHFVVADRILLHETQFALREPSFTQFLDLTQVLRPLTLLLKHAIESRNFDARSEIFLRFLHGRRVLLHVTLSTLLNRERIGQGAEAVHDQVLHSLGHLNSLFIFMHLLGRQRVHRMMDDRVCKLEATLLLVAEHELAGHGLRIGLQVHLLLCRNILAG